MRRVGDVEYTGKGDVHSEIWCKYVEVKRLIGKPSHK
jgi:hypothetical protein